MPLIPVLWRLKQEHLECKASIGYRVQPGLHSIILPQRTEKQKKLREKCPYIINKANRAGEVKTCILVDAPDELAHLGLEPRKANFMTPGH